MKTLLVLFLAVMGIQLVRGQSTSPDLKWVVTWENGTVKVCNVETQKFDHIDSIDCPPKEQLLQFTQKVLSDIKRNVKWSLESDAFIYPKADTFIVFHLYGQRQAMERPVFAKGIADALKIQTFDWSGKFEGWATGDTFAWTSKRKFVELHAKARIVHGNCELLALQSSPVISPQGKTIHAQLLSAQGKALSGQLVWGTSEKYDDLLGYTDEKGGFDFPRQSGNVRIQITNTENDVGVDEMVNLDKVLPSNLKLKMRSGVRVEGTVVGLSDLSLTKRPYTIETGPNEHPPGLGAESLYGMETIQQVDVIEPIDIHSHFESTHFPPHVAWLQVNGLSGQSPDFETDEVTKVLIEGQIVDPKSFDLPVTKDGIVHMQVFVKQPSRGALSPDGQWKVTGGQLLNTRTGQSIPQEGDYFASLAGMWGADESDYDDAVNMALGEGVKWAPDSRAFTVPSREKRESYFSIYVLADGKWVNFGLDSDEPLGIYKGEVNEVLGHYSRPSNFDNNWETRFDYFEARRWLSPGVLLWTNGGPDIVSQIIYEQGKPRLKCLRFSRNCDSYVVTRLIQGRLSLPNGRPAPDRLVWIEDRSQNEALDTGKVNPDFKSINSILMPCITDDAGRFEMNVPQGKALNCFFSPKDDAGLYVPIPPDAQTVDLKLLPAISVKGEIIGLAPEDLSKGQLIICPLTPTMSYAGYQGVAVNTDGSFVIEHCPLSSVHLTLSGPSSKSFTVSKIEIDGRQVKNFSNFDIPANNGTVVQLKVYVHKSSL